MTRNLSNALVLIGAVVTLGAGLGAAQRGWTVPGKSSATGSRTLVARPQAQIVNSANGLYCTPAIENGVDIHDIGGLSAGLHVTVTVAIVQRWIRPGRGSDRGDGGPEGGQHRQDRHLLRQRFRRRQRRNDRLRDTSYGQLPLGRGRLRRCHHRVLSLRGHNTLTHRIASASGVAVVWRMRSCGSDHCKRGVNLPPGWPSAPWRLAQPTAQGCRRCPAEGSR